MASLWLYIVSVVVLTLIPGPDLIFLITQGLTKGRKEAVFTALGLSSGCLFHTTLAAFGVSIIFQQSAIAFNVLKILGVLYLLYLSIKSYLSAEKFSLSSNTEAKSGYFKGVLMNVLNPKVILFYLAFLPQFVPAHTNKVWAYMMFLGLIFAVIAAIILTIVAFISSALNDLLLKNNKAIVIINKIGAFTIFLLALFLAFTSKG